MANEITQPKTLQERVGERIRDQIGDLLTDADLKTLVDRAMHDAFFVGEPIRDHWGTTTGRTKEPPIQTLVAKLMQERVDGALNAWLDANPDKVKEIIEDVIAKGVVGFLQQWFSNRTQSTLFSFGDNLMSVLRSKGLNV